MTTKSNISINDTEDSHSSISPSAQSKPEIYPQVNDRLKGAVMWLGLVFVVLVIFVQYFSGYS